ncbi:MAG TPA: glycosyl transferase family 1 [Rhodospirillaceae bacterium]|nr:glycosyl transferase family 1 [Rhodospirillaceae bacterium]
MRIAFYAPMKAPTHPTPSGDRSFARLIIRALRRAGHDVVLASSFRSYDRDGTNQGRLAHRAERARERASGRLRKNPPDIWFTYHVYHKAPDYLGPQLSAHFRVPYIVADASHAPKQARGPWAEGFKVAQRAILAADRLIYFDPLDAICLRQDLRRGDRLAQLPPFTARRAVTPAERRAARKELSARLKIPEQMPWAITVAMMRDDIKTDSYRMLAESAQQCCHPNWALLIAGDGINRPQIEEAFKGLTNARFLGELAGRDLSQLYAAGDLLAWPALQEGCAMSLLEAAGAGLPVVAGERPGLERFIDSGKTGYLCAEGDPDTFSERLGLLLTDPTLRRQFGANAADRARREFSLEAAAEGLDRIMSKLSWEHAA